MTEAKYSFASLFPGRVDFQTAHADDNNPLGVGKNRLLTPGRLNLHEQDYWKKSNAMYRVEGKTHDNRHVSVEGSTMLGVSKLDNLTDRLNSKVTSFKKGV